MGTVCRALCCPCVSPLQSHAWPSSHRLAALEEHDFFLDLVQDVVEGVVQVEGQKPTPSSNMSSYWIRQGITAGFPACFLQLYYYKQLPH